MKPLHAAMLLLLGAIWGASFLFIGVAVPSLGPLLLMDARVFLAAGALLLYAALFRQIPDLMTRWREFLMLGALNAAIPFTLIAFSQLTLTASLAAIINSTTPLFTALVAAVWIDEPLTLRKATGALLGIGGVFLLVGGSPLQLNTTLILAVVTSLIAAFCYGLGTVYASEHFRETPILTTSIGQLLGAGLLLLLPSLTAVPTAAPPVNALLALLALSLLSTSFAYLLYFYLVNHIGPTRTAAVTFLVPVFGTLWGVLFLQEPFTPGMLLGMGVILGSVGLVTGAPRVEPDTALPD
jgi:drug/metabolite transporter (DMT)-like permease